MIILPRLAAVNHSLPAIFCGVSLVLLLYGEARAELGDHLFKLNASNGQQFDQLGWSVATSGDRALVGAIADSGGGPLHAPASIFDLTTGHEIITLTPTDLAAGQDIDFGYSVGISNNLAIVGAPDDRDKGFLAGAAYLFDTVTGEQRHKLTANDGGGFQRFGYAVALEGSTAIVGATSAGGAYVFDASTGEQSFKLRALDLEPSDTFGYSVALSGTVAVIGAPNDNDGGNSSGSAYLFNTTDGQQIAKITAADVRG